MNKTLRMIIVLTVIGLVSGGVLSLVYNWALPKIIENQIRETDAAVFKVVPGTTSYKEVIDEELIYFECFDKNKRRIGTAILCKGNGYQGEIKLMIGINAEMTKFTGMIVLEQLETPGLGAKIAEEKFQAQFKGLLAKPPIGDQVEAITGATISSRAVVRIIDKAVKEWMEKTF